MGCQKKDQDQKTQTVAKNVSLICCPDGLVDSTGRRGSSAGRLPLVREEAVGTGDRQPPWREPWWWLLLLEWWSWWSWLLWLPQTGCNGLGTWNGRQTTAAMKHHVGDYQGCHCDDQDFSKLDENDYHFTEHSWNWNGWEGRNDGLLYFFYLHWKTYWLWEMMSEMVVRWSQTGFNLYNIIT